MTEATIRPWLRMMAVALPVLMLASCGSTTVRSTSHEEVVVAAEEIPEEQLLDIGIGLFDPGLEEDEADEDPGISPRIRRAEARYMPYQLMETLQGTGNWGIVRVIPERQSEADIWVDAEILQSDGLTTALLVTVTDSSGARWYQEKYTGTVSKYAYDNALSHGSEPFQGLYNDIANDLLEYYQNLSPEAIAELRTITELRFARRFSPEAFDQHLGTDRDGELYVRRLPAENDPVLMRVRQVRERDYMFVDTLQEHYGSFVRQMDVPYLEWRKAYYEEGQALREVEAQSNRRLVGGALAVLAGILAQGSDSSTVRTAGAVGIGAGAGVFVSGLNKREEAKVHAEALDEITASMDSEMEPHTIQLQERTVTLSGSVNDQYEQWREVLREMYTTETGQTGASGSP
ncbi:hypothetical protein [Elongatibacter sediminis]|uniref:Lipoprotein n=1 Tax=Elongatibacter sediminis TaxID=3119006 RepID=A0AAW9RAB2_9GAMM